jgi:probable addiction module antidote protein
MAGYLNAALQEQELAVFLLALRYVADVHGVSKVAADARLNRENVYRMLSDRGNPTLNSLRKILNVLGMDLRVTPQPQSVSLEVTTTVPGKLISSDLEQLQPILNAYRGNDNESTIPTNNESLAA